MCMNPAGWSQLDSLQILRCVIVNTCVTALSLNYRFWANDSRTRDPRRAWWSVTGVRADPTAALPNERSSAPPESWSAVGRAAHTQWEIVLQLNDRKMSMAKNAESGLQAERLYQTWFGLFSASGGYRKVRGGWRRRRSGGLHSHATFFETSARRLFQIIIGALQWSDLVSDDVFHSSPAVAGWHFWGFFLLKLHRLVFTQTFCGGVEVQPSVAV